MGLSKNQPSDKKPISAAKLAQLLKGAKRPRIEAKLPSLMETPTPKPKIKVPAEIAPAKAEGTAVAKKFSVGYSPSEVFERTLDNTVGMMSDQMGVATPDKGSYEYNTIKDDILKNKPSLTTTTDESGKPVFGLKTTAADDFLSGFNSFTNTADKGFNYAASDKTTNINSLEDLFKKRFTTSLPKVENPILNTLGQMAKPLAQGVTGAITGMALAGPYGAAGGFLGGALATFALSAPEGVAVRYASELEDAYLKAREQGLSKEQAYDKANNVAIAGAGGETAMQAIYSTFGAPATAAKPATKILNESAKKTFAETASKFAKKSYEFAKPAAFLGTEAALTTGITEVEAAKQGISTDTEESIKKSLETGSEFALLDMGLRGLLGLAKVPGYIKNQSKNLLQTADRNVVRDFVKQGEAAGIYPAGSMNKVSTEINLHEKAKQQSPKYPGDEARESVVAGLTQKLNNLESQQSKLAEIHKADLQPQIDDVKRRIEKAKTAKNPLEAEIADDGNPLIITEKNKDYATTESTGEVKEVLPESGITERERVIGEQQKEAASQKTPDEAGDSNRPVVSEEQVAPITLADRFRKLKINEAVLTGGDKGVAQTNIVGLPIAIYNASIEAIAKGLEAGGVLADLIEQQVKALKEGGYKLDEKKYRKSVELMSKLPDDRAKVKAESEMSGIKAVDYAMLQRLVLEKYNEPTGIYKDIDMMTKALRDELDKKMDTSQISDEVFEMLAYDAIANEAQAPFMPKAAKRIKIEGVDVEPETIITNPKEVFKSMYTAAANVNKGIEERLLGAANMISEYIKKKDKLDVAPKDIAKAMSRFISSKMDSETASEVFAENLSDIIESARDANQIAANKATIKKIKKDAKSPTYGTLGTRQSTDGIDFLSPNKIKDSVSPENVSEVTLLGSEKRRKYQELLDDYRNSITGKPTKSNRARLDLKEFIEAERRNFEEFQERKNVEKRAKSGKKYDSLVAEGKINADEVSREEFIDADTNIEKRVSDRVEQAVNEAEVDKVEAYKQVVEQKRKTLSEEKKLGNLDESDMEEIDFLINADLSKVSPRNLKLLSNIIEDILNGERPSRVGELASDISVRNSLDILKANISNIRNVAKAKYSGAYRFFRKAFSKSYKEGDTSISYADELGITNLIRALTMNKGAEDVFRSVILGPFEKFIKNINTLSREYTENIYSIFAKDSVTINGEKISFEGEPVLTEKNSQKVGMVAALLNYENPLNTINAIIESTKILHEGKMHDHIVQERLLALEELGVIDRVPKTADEISNIPLLESFDTSSALSKLNRREQVFLQYLIDTNKKVAEPLSRITRNYYGESVDISSPNYVSQTTFTTDALESIEDELKEEIFNYNQVNKMRASSTMQRNKEMLFPKRDGSKVVHYDFDAFRTQPKKFHESLTTIYTTAETKRMSKLFASKEFQDFIKGKHNIKPELLQDNMRVFKKIMVEYVNGERKPYVVSKEIENQRNAVSRFIYGKLLNSLEAGALQYVPNLPSLIMESPQSFAKSMEIVTSSLFNEEKSKALVEFLTNTSKANRITGGIEALTKSAKSISDNDLTRNASNLYKWLDGFSGLSLEYGDRATTVQSLLTGYIKALIKKGKIKSASEFDIVAHMKEGIDQDALSSAETFMSFMNNESSTYAKAKVFRKDGASILRMLQSFSHNGMTNFLIDVGRFNDEMANTSDRVEALKRMAQYMFSVANYGIATYYAGEFRKKMSRDALKYMGVIEDSEDLEKAITKDKEKTYELIRNGIIFDAMLSRQVQPVAEIAKGAADLYYQFNRNKKIEEAESLGEDLSATTLSGEYSPFYQGKYIGTAGTLFTDFERLSKSFMKPENTEYKNLLTPEQREAQRYLRDAEIFGFFTPSKDVKRWVNAANKSLKQGKVTQLEKDAHNYIVAKSDVSKGKYEEFQIEQAREYLDDRRKIAQSKNRGDEFDVYIKTKVKDFAENKIERDELVAKAKQYGPEFSRDVLNIKAASPNKKIKIFNNRFAGKSRRDSVVRFMLENDVISPEDYAMSTLFDKNGKFKSEPEASLLYNAAATEYMLAKLFVKYNINEYTIDALLGKLNNIPDKLSLKTDIEREIIDFTQRINKMKVERYTRGELQE